MEAMYEERNINIEQPEWRPVPPELQDGLSTTGLSKAGLRSWLLVLEARGIPCRGEQHAGHWLLLVPVSYYRQACRELREYEQENRNWPPPPPVARKLHENTASTIWVLILLAVFHNLVVQHGNPFGSAPLNWLDAGNADALKISQGQWWRAVTALTLHSGPVHLAGNIIVGGLFSVRLCWLLGSGSAWFLILCSGTFGNLINALMQAPDHRSIGASTAVFGAVGLLAVINMLYHRPGLWRRWPLPLAAALGLLALLGSSGENTDLGAHLFGFCCGIAFGLLWGKLLPPQLTANRLLSYTLAAVSVGLLGGSWWLALHH